MLAAVFFPMTFENKTFFLEIVIGSFDSIAP